MKKRVFLVVVGVLGLVCILLFLLVGLQFTEITYVYAEKPQHSQIRTFACDYAPNHSFDGYIYGVTGTAEFASIGQAYDELISSKISEETLIRLKNAGLNQTSDSVDVFIPEKVYTPILPSWIKGQDEAKVYWGSKYYSYSTKILESGWLFTISEPDDYNDQIKHIDTAYSNMHRISDAEFDGVRAQQYVGKSILLKVFNLSTDTKKMLCILTYDFAFDCKHIKLWITEDDVCYCFAVDGGKVDIPKNIDAEALLSIGVTEYTE